MIRLKTLRNEKHLSQKKLAEQLGVSQQAICKYEKGLAEPDISMLKRISDLFGVSVDYLIGQTDNPYIANDMPAITYEEMQVIQKIRDVSPAFRKNIIGLLENPKN